MDGGLVCVVADTGALRPVRWRVPRQEPGARDGGAGLEHLAAAEATVSAGRGEQGEAAVSLPTGAPEPTCEPPNKQMQPTAPPGRGHASSVIWMVQRRVAALQLICRSLGRLQPLQSEGQSQSICHLFHQAS
jgi:hypothetical protein